MQYAPLSPQRWEVTSSTLPNPILSGTENENSVRYVMEV